MLADENVEAHETHFLVVRLPPWVNFLYGPSGSGELKIKAKNGSEIGQNWSKYIIFTINAFHAHGMRRNFLDAWPTLVLSGVFLEWNLLQHIDIVKGNMYVMMNRVHSRRKQHWRKEKGRYIFHTCT